MSILLSFLAAVVIGFIAYLIAGVIPFLAPYQGLVGLLVFLAVLLSGYSTGWFNNRRGL